MQTNVLRKVDKNISLIYTVDVGSETVSLHTEGVYYMYEKQGGKRKFMNTSEKQFKRNRTEQLEQLLNIYYENNACRLHEMVKQILFKFGGLPDKDMDDFYSLANEVFVDTMRRYDGEQSFDVFLYACLNNKIKSELTRRNRTKRRADRLSVSIDAPIGDDEETTLGDTIAGSFDMEKEILGEKEDEFSERMRLYLGRLSGVQREILKYAVEGYTPAETQEALHISEKEYSDCNLAIHSYRNISVLL